MKYFLYARRSTDEEKQSLSIVSQRERLLESFKGFEIIELEPESASAFKPYNRPIFAQMIERIEKGEAQGIIAWHPDRLSRNPIDAAQLIYALDRGILKDLKFCSYNFDNSPEGKMMLSFALSQSKYYSEKLGKDVMRGMEKKCSMGHYPSRAPVGYKNVRTEEKGSRYIVKDEERFPLVRRAWEMLLTGGYTVPEIWQKARDEWRLTIPHSRKLAERPVTLSCFYGLFTNPFYTGCFEWNGKKYMGEYPQMVSQKEFETAQRIISGDNWHKQEIHSFPFTGFIHCTECGAHITAEIKRKKLKSGEINEHIYYHCTGKRGPCTQRKCIREKDLFPQMHDVIASISISPEIMAWLKEVLARLIKEDQKDQKRQLSIIQQKYDRTVSSMQNLLNLYVSPENADKNLLTEEEYKAQKNALTIERDRNKRLLNELERNVDTSIERALRTFEFAADALKYFEKGDDQTRRMILVSIGSNWRLFNGIAICDMKFQYKSLADAKERLARNALTSEPRFSKQSISENPKGALTQTEKQEWYPGQESNL